MDIQFWIWLIIIVITLIARASRQKRPQPPPREDYQEKEKPSSRPLTFEELLKEIQAAKEQRQQAPQEPARQIRPAEPMRPYAEAEPEPTVYKEVDYDDNVGEEEQDLETITEERDDRQSTDVYERAKREAFSRPSLEETLKLEDTIVRFGQFKGYETQTQKAPMADFLAEIKDPEGFRKAFIMSEILTRKF
jgi:hypothetical protein